MPAHAAACVSTPHLHAVGSETFAWPVTDLVRGMLGADDCSHMRTEIVEEVMSISDGQIVLQEAQDEHVVPRLNFASSLSRMGTRAYYIALQELAPQVWQLCGNLEM